MKFEKRTKMLAAKKRYISANNEFLLRKGEQMREDVKLAQVESQGKIVRSSILDLYSGISESNAVAASGAWISNAHRITNRLQGLKEEMQVCCAKFSKRSKYSQSKLFYAKECFQKETSKFSAKNSELISAVESDEAHSERLFLIQGVLP